MNGAADERETERENFSMQYCGSGSSVQEPMCCPGCRISGHKSCPGLILVTNRVAQLDSTVFHCLGELVGFRVKRSGSFEQSNIVCFRVQGV